MTEILMQAKMMDDVLVFSSIDVGSSVGDRKLREEIAFGGDFCWDG